MGESRFFSSENRFFSAMNKLADMLILNILFLFTVLLFIGPACTALYYTSIKNIRKGRGYTYKEYFRSFRLNLKQGIVCGMIQIILAAMLAMSYLMADSMDANSMMGQVYYSGVLVILLVFVLLHLYLYPLLSRFSLSIGQLFKMSFYLSMRHFAVSLALLALFAAAAVGCYIVPPAIFLLPALYSFVSTFLMERILKKYMPKPEETSEETGVDTWYYE